MNAPARRNELGEVLATFTPIWLRRVCFSMIVVIVAGAVFIVVSAPGTSDGYSLPDQLGWYATVTFLCVILWRFGSTRAYLHLSGLVVRNFFRTYRLHWAQVFSIGFTAEDSFALIETTKGNQISSIALAKSEGNSAREFVARAQEMLNAFDQEHDA